MDFLLDTCGLSLLTTDRWGGVTIMCDMSGLIILISDPQVGLHPAGRGPQVPAHRAGDPPDGDYQVILASDWSILVT